MLITRRVQSLRRERRKSICQTSVTGTNEVCQSKWFAFKSLLFLIDRNKPRQTQCTDEIVEQDDFEESRATVDMENEASSTNDVEKECVGHAEEHTSDQPYTQERQCKRKESLSHMKIVLPNKKKRIVEDPRVTEAYRILKEVSKRNEKRDHCIVYGEHIAHKLRGYDSRTCAIVQYHINNVLFEADMGKYSNGNLDNQQPVHWESGSWNNGQCGSSLPNVTSASSSPQSQHNVDIMKMEPDMLSSQWETQLPASFTLVAVKCEVEDEAKDFMAVKTGVKDEVTTGEHEAKIEDCNGNSQHTAMYKSVDKG
ncbi:uncharacterized protein LOC110830905 isoform X3 [Zootermopsis nevadensis]|uniref:uncharacterized protein LOC110830905 isoform X3 n=1 Tax=Zootermopsis nevadensis TaxID=136037 RepID=UPI000B8E3431|nr:uncharacterized protein LOC110830905 isoform X3 [Zootermopsis nevadensis]